MSDDAKLPPGAERIVRGLPMGPERNRAEALEEFWEARRNLLEAWVAALPHLSAADAIEEEQGTASAMTQLRKVRADGGEWR